MNNHLLSFAQIRDRLSRCDDGYVVEVPDHWRQGRTAYGGLTVGLGVATAHREVAQLPSLRSMIVNFTGPVMGVPLFVPTVLRKGKSVTVVQVTVRAEAAIAAQMVLCFGGSRETKLNVFGPMQPLPRPPGEYEPYIPPAAIPLAPQFATHFDTRLIAGARPVAAAEEGYVRVVSRHLDADSHRGIDALTVLADILPPAALVMAAAPAPVSSVTWMMNLLTDDPQTDEGWWQLDAKLTAAGDGYSSQQMRIWSLDGTLVAEGMQSVAQFF